MTEPTSILNHGGMPLRNFSFDMEAARKHAKSLHHGRFRNRNMQWEGDDVHTDIVMMTMLVETLVIELHEMNKSLPSNIQRDLCPCCGGHTWTRPLQPDVHAMDFSLRMCSVCKWTRPEPNAKGED